MDGCIIGQWFGENKRYSLAEAGAGLRFHQGVGGNPTLTPWLTELNQNQPEALAKT